MDPAHPLLLDPLAEWIPPVEVPKGGLFDAALGRVLVCKGVGVQGCWRARVLVCKP